MKEEKVGFVSNYFGKISVVAIEITEGKLRVGDNIHFRGHTTDLTETIESMQIEHEDVSEAKAGDSVGIRVHGKVRKKDKVFRVVED